jgi:uncharacterized integral membrane protein
MGDYMQAQKVKLWTLTAMAVLITIIATQNMGPVDLKLLFWDLTLPFIVFLGIVFTAGLFFGYTMARLKRKKDAGSRAVEGQDLPVKRGLFKKR